jgi:hypothetical protein
MSRPPVSLSQALHCRMEIWLNAHGYDKEPIEPGAQRTFDMGNMIEAAFFDGTGTESGIPWFYSAKTISEPNGTSIDTALWDIKHRQLEVELFGLKGHIDALLVNKNGSGTILVDTKSASGFSYDRAISGNLMESPFSREYVGQLHAYYAALEKMGMKPDLMALIYFNKEQSKLMLRFVPFDEPIMREMEDRLLWARNGSGPEPDWEWDKGKQIPLRCGYCAQKMNCAEVRGDKITLGFTKKSAPVWIVE